MQPLRLARNVIKTSAQGRTFSQTWSRSFASTSLARDAVPDPSPSAGEQQIIDKLMARFSPSRLAVQDVSGGCGTFYAITIASPAFKGLPTIKQHRLVTQELKEEVAVIHGLQLKTIPE